MIMTARIVNSFVICGGYFYAKVIVYFISKMIIKNVLSVGFNSSAYNI